MITPEQIEATRQTLRRAVLRETLVLELRTAGRDDTGRHRPFLVALDALVAFERAEEAYDRMAACCAAPEQIGWCHKSANPCSNCVANDEAETTLAQIIKDTGAVQE